MTSIGEQYMQKAIEQAKIADENGNAFCCIYNSQKFNTRDLGKGYEQKGKAGLQVIMRKKIPKFKNEDRERQFWSKHDSTDFINWKKGKRIVPGRLKPSLKTISVRLPEMMVEELKLLANKKDVPYQSLLKMYLSERIEAELEHSIL